MKNVPLSSSLLALRRSLSETYTIPPHFSDEQKERDFLSFYGRKFASFRRAAIGLGIGMWTIFYWWDFHNYQADPTVFTYEALKDVLTVRTLGLIALLTTFCISLRERFAEDRYAHIILLNGIVAAKLCVIAMVAIVPSPLNYIYYFSGLYLILIFQFGFAHLRAHPVLICTCAGIGALLGIQLVGTIEPTAEFLRPEHFTSAGFYYFFICFIGYGICVKFERYARQQFDSETTLSEANEKLTRQNSLLEKSQEISRIKSRALLLIKEGQRDRAVQSNQDKSRFLASAAHDLRQPMFALSLSLEALRVSLQERDWAEAEKLLKVCQKSVKVTVGSFNAILDLSRLESGFVHPEYTNFDVLPLLEEIRDELAQFAEARNVHLRCRSRQSMFVHSDRGLLCRVIKNLVTNGVKYGKQSQEKRSVVILGAVRLSTHVRIDVLDNGIGIPASDWNRIFEPFVQLSKTQRNRENGLGLGLSIVNAAISILDQHRLEMKSWNGKGTRFSIRSSQRIGTGARASSRARVGIDFRRSTIVDLAGRLCYCDRRR